MQLNYSFSIIGLREITEKVTYFGVGRRIVGPQPGAEEARKKQLEQEALTVRKGGTAREPEPGHTTKENTQQLPN